MEEREFLVLADAELSRIETALERLQESVDFDFEPKPGGILEIAFDNGGKIIVNRHTAAREIWVAARSGGFHFKPPAMPGNPWSGTRDDEALSVVLGRCLGELAGEAVALSW